MPIRILISLVVFTGVFFLTRLLYPNLEAIFQRWRKRRLNKIAPKFDRIFLNIPLRKLMLIDTLSPILSGGLGFMLFGNITGAVAFAGIGLILPMLIIKQLEIRYRKRFASQLVDGLLILSNSLKAGLSLYQSFEELVKEMPAPISQEFSLLIRQMQMGVSLEEALTNLKKRMQLEELDMVVTAILVARETGGDLITTFSRVISTIQEHNKLMGRVKALCVQGKLQGAIMSVLPILFGLFVYKANPNFFDIFLKDNLGRGLLAYAVFSEGLGIFFIRKFSRVEI